MFSIRNDGLRRLINDFINGAPARCLWAKGINKLKCCLTSDGNSSLPIIVVNSNINNRNTVGSEAIGSLEKIFCFDASSLLSQLANPKALAWRSKSRRKVSVDANPIWSQRFPRMLHFKNNVIFAPVWNETEVVILRHHQNVKNFSLKAFGWKKGRSFAIPAYSVRSCHSGV